MGIATFALMKVNNKLLIGQKDFTFTPSTTMIETSNKLTGNDSSFKAGRTSAKISIAGILDGLEPQNTLAGYWEMFALQQAGAEISVTFMEYTDKTGSTPVDGSVPISVTALISGLPLTAPDNANLGFSCELQVTGSIQASSTDFAAFTLPGQISSTINTATHTVYILMPSAAVLTSLAATFAIAGGGTAAVGGDAQVSGVTTNDFSAGATYAVTSADLGTTQNWTISVTKVD